VKPASRSAMTLVLIASPRQRRSLLSIATSPSSVRAGATAGTDFGGLLSNSAASSGGSSKLEARAAIVVASPDSSVRSERRSGGDPDLSPSINGGGGGGRVAPNHPQHF